MSEVKVGWERLLLQLRARASRLEEYNLILVALPLDTAHENAPKIQHALKARYVDFDRELIRMLEADDWADHVALAHHGHLAPGRELIEELLNEVAATFTSTQPVVVGNPNLAAFYDIDLGAQLYPRTRDGHCILAAPGRVRGQTLLLHGLHPQTGSGFTPIWQLAADQHDRTL